MEAIVLLTRAELAESLSGATSTNGSISLQVLHPQNTTTNPLCSLGGYHTCGITVKDSNGRNQMVHLDLNHYLRRCLRQLRCRSERLAQVCWGLADDGQTTPYYPGSAASVLGTLTWTMVLLLLLLVACT